MVIYLQVTPMACHLESDAHPMELLSLVYRHYRWPFVIITLLSLLSALLGIGVIAFINERLITSVDEPLWVLGQLIGLILLLLLITLGSQLALTTLGHHFVYNLRGKLLKQVLDTDVERLRDIGQAPLLASLSKDIASITLAFVRLPELVQGSILTLGASLYLIWLSASMFMVTAIWVVVTLVLGWMMVQRVYHHLKLVRGAEDRLYQDYQAIIDGSRELMLNRQRAQALYEDQYEPNAREFREHVIRADTYHLSAVNWSNIMMLGAIGLAFFLANTLGWANNQIAATFALTLLFLRTPMLQAIGALPTLIAAQVAFDKVRALALAEHRPDFPEQKAAQPWQTLTLEEVSFAYQGRESERSGFAVGPLSLTLTRGDQVFLIGGNGSGKSTLAMLLTGLYRPVSGRILLDGKPVEDQEAYRQLFSAIFTDFYLFDRLLGPQGVDSRDIDEWLARLNMGSKLQLDGDRILDIRLSQGQRKRVALLLAIAEQRDIMLFDEWAADQDPQFRRIFYQVLLPRLREMGKTVVAISHDDHYFALADRLLEMRSGQLHELGSAERAALSDVIGRLNQHEEAAVV